MKRALLFDLDDTLVPEFASYGAAAAAAYGALVQGGAVDAAALWTTLRAAARDLWRDSPVIAYCEQLQIGSATALFSDFSGDGPELTYLREWAPVYRRDTWTGALRALGVEPGPLATHLAEASRACFGTHCRPYEDAVPALEELQGSYTLAVITNGPADVQRAKLRHTGLDRFFPTVVISSEIGFAKPHEGAFAAALRALGTSADETVMIGDHLERDVAGARRAGLAAIWLNRSRATRPEGVDGVPEVASQADAASLLSTF